MDLSGFARRGCAALAAVVLALLPLASPAGANGVTFPIAAGSSGPYDYEVGVGPFSPLRTDLFVAVTPDGGGQPRYRCRCHGAGVSGWITRFGRSPGGEQQPGSSADL